MSGLLRIRDESWYQARRRIQSWDELRPFGIDLLTGEACGLAMRLLCDVTAAGRKLIEGFLSCNLRDDSNWNGGSKDDPHVASVMLTRAVFNDLAAYILVSTCQRDDTNIAAYAEGGAVEYTGTEYIPTGLLGRHYRRSAAPGTGLRNEHMASGRVA